MSSFSFHNLGRIGSDNTDQTQRTLYNTRFANYMLADYTISQNPNGAVDFATAHPTMIVNGLTGGQGINGTNIDIDSALTIKQEQQRAFEKLSLHQRPFSTVPYLGRGSCNTDLESQLQQGEIVTDKKSVSTIMEKSFGDYSLYPLDDNMQERATNVSNIVQESALNGWVRGGSDTRQVNQDK